MIEELQCNCEEYLKGVQQLNSMIAFGYIHHGAEYTAEPFKYCAWCGKKLRVMVKCEECGDYLTYVKNSDGKYCSIVAGEDGIAFYFEKICRKCRKNI